jgi:hypothetical protein
MCCCEVICLFNIAENSQSGHSGPSPMKKYGLVGWTECNENNITYIHTDTEQLACCELCFHLIFLPALCLQPFHRHYKWSVMLKLMHGAILTFPHTSSWHGMQWSTRTTLLFSLHTDTSLAADCYDSCNDELVIWSRVGCLLPTLRCIISRFPYWIFNFAVTDFLSPYVSVSVCLAICQNLLSCSK